MRANLHCLLLVESRFLEGRINGGIVKELRQGTSRLGFILFQVFIEAVKRNQSLCSVGDTTWRRQEARLLDHIDKVLVKRERRHHLKLLLAQRLAQRRVDEAGERKYALLKAVEDGRGQDT